MTAGRSAAARAAQLRANARRSWWQRLLALLGIRTPHARRTANAAARWAHGAEGEAHTARLLAPLQTAGWHLRHDLALPRSRANLDHVLVSPCGTALVVLDTKRWHRGKPTHLLSGRIHCGQDDRHNQVEAVARYAHRVATILGLPAGQVAPLLVIHGSPILGGRLEAHTPHGLVHVLGTDGLLPTLHAAPQGRANAHAAARLAARVDQHLRPYQQ
ncbi:nuclease-related domain-containing protein [Streptomyces albidoflavus]|uniref:nuclease-related domain-containing protein n=1 Tax=Streptomyces albidoflavus TaxID=1886 RepID=UPI003411CC13